MLNLYSFDPLMKNLLMSRFYFFSCKLFPSSGVGGFVKNLTGQGFTLQTNRIQYTIETCYGKNNLLYNVFSYFFLCKIKKCIYNRVQFSIGQNLLHWDKLESCKIYLTIKKIVFQQYPMFFQRLPKNPLDLSNNSLASNKQNDVFSISVIIIHH